MNYSQDQLENISKLNIMNYLLGNQYHRFNNDFGDDRKPMWFFRSRQAEKGNGSLYYENNQFHFRTEKWNNESRYEHCGLYARYLSDYGEVGSRSICSPTIKLNEVDKSKDHIVVIWDKHSKRFFANIMWYGQHPFLIGDLLAIDYDFCRFIPTYLYAYQIKPNAYVRRDGLFFINYGIEKT